mgnify:CR=1 FL=1
MPPSSATSGSRRFLKRTDGIDFQGMAGGFGGVEYFVAPKLSIGAEVGVALHFSTKGKAEDEYQTLDSNLKVVTEKEKSGGSNSFSFTTQSVGRLNVTFHF